MQKPILFNKLLLIQSVQARPSIWDKGSADYNCKETRKECWIEICRIMIEGYDNYSALEKEKYSQDCQKYWKKIRDSYRRSLNLRKDCKSSSRAKNKPIKYEKELEFLKQYIEQDIPQVTNLDDSSAHSINDDSQPVEPPYQANSPVSQPGSVSRYPSQTLKHSQQPREPQEPRDTTSEILSRYLETKTEEDSTDYFFKSMASKVKGMPNKMKAEIERKIFQIVNAAELKLSEQEEFNLLYSSRGQSVMKHSQSSVGNDHTKIINAAFAHYQTGKNNNPINKYDTYTPSNCSDETDITDPLSNFEIRRNKSCTDKNKTYTRSKRASRSLPYTYTPSSVRNDKNYELFTNECNDDMFTPSP